MVFEENISKKIKSNPMQLSAFLLDWFDEKHQGKEFLRKSTQVKNIWIPYGE